MLISTVFRNPDQEHFFYLSQRSQSCLKIKTVYIPKRGIANGKNNVKCLILVYITKNDLNDEVTLYLIRN